MKLRLVLAAAALTGLTACATVDLAEVTSSSSSARASTVERNVVQRAAAKLFAVFSNKGLTAKASKKRVQSAASVLLKGLEKTDASSSAAYADQNKSFVVVQSDLRAASKYVNQTTKAAEVYLAMAPADANVRGELESLERALLVSRQVELVFAAALDNAGSIQTGEYTMFTQSVDGLRDVTNAYGDRVRETQIIQAQTGS